MRQVGDNGDAWWREAEAPPQSSHTSTLSSFRPQAETAVASEDEGSQHRVRTRRRSSLVLVAGLAALSGTVAIIVIGGIERGQARDTALWHSLDRLAAAAGLGIDQVSVSGHHMTDEQAIFEALDLPNAASIARFGAKDAQARIARLPWIDTANITVTFPNSIDVRVTERKAYAVWRRAGEDVMIDVSGRVLSAVPAGRSNQLPIVAGDGAAPDASIILQTVARFPALAERLLSAERIAARRWALHLTDNVLVHLPPDREASVLAGLTTAAEGLKALEGRDQVIDLRTEGRMIVRPHGGSASGT